MGETCSLGPCIVLWPKQLGFDLAVSKGNSGPPTPTLPPTTVSGFMVKSQDQLQYLQVVEVGSGRASHAEKAGGARRG